MKIVFRIRFKIYGQTAKRPAYRASVVPRTLTSVGSWIYGRRERLNFFFSEYFRPAARHARALLLRTTRLFIIIIIIVAGYGHAVDDCDLQVSHVRAQPTATARLTWTGQLFWEPELRRPFVSSFQRFPCNFNQFSFFFPPKASRTRSERAGDIPA